MPHPLSESTQTQLALPQSWPNQTHGPEVAMLRNIRGVCLDIDDTLSTHGKLTHEAFSALWKLHEAGFVVVPVTGRPAGWCDHIVRFWPVDAIIGENGAFTFYMDQGVRRRVNTPCGLEEKDWQNKKKQLAQGIHSRFPKANWASDQAYREMDLAIDICEDVDPWPDTEVDALLDYCRQQGAYAKLSSIHVNAWVGHYDKRKGFDHWLSLGAPGCSEKKGKQILSSSDSLDPWIYIGDSPNDESMFARFTYSVGVANIKKYLHQLRVRPTWITSGESGKGFAEMAQLLVSI